MPDTGFKYTSTNPTISGTGSDWLNPNNIKGAPDGSAASTALVGTGSSKKLRILSLSFGMPAGSVATGVLVRIRAKGGGGGA